MNQTLKGAETYEKTSGLLQQRYFDVLISSANVKKGWNILDLGCGTGNGTLKLANIVGPKGKVIGIDPIAHRIEVAKDKNSADNIEYHVGFGQNAVEFGKDTFDLVISGSVLHWNEQKEKEKIFKSVLESLKSGGIFVFSSIKDLNTMNTNAFFDLVKDKSFKSILHSKFYVSTVDEYVAMASDAGFVESNGRSEIIRIHFENVNSIIELLASSIHTVGFNEFLNELRAIIDDENVDKSFLYDKLGAYQETEQLFLKCFKQ